ncbi:hypothetical protein CDD82_4384 [Ophiocordyceps australis]|uniref:Rrn9 domain-containing protein n=1 Tax=Ophiocordyceps australis TaxID=1399860 RepID=A0A2C5XKM2_9HYPO|nr:hypothetical protein CDD82_4384 [Ophiocordyceps australis]
MSDEPALPNWDLTSDEIASVSSQDLHAYRPNRWRRAASTWRAANQQEREVWRAMQKLEAEDLGVHLYNAFALKETRRRADGATDSQPWAPSKSWTAWPLKEKYVPRVNLLGQRDEAEDKDTVRCRDKSSASRELHEEISAMVLRLANRRFGKRRRRMERMARMERQGQRGAGEAGEEQTVRRSIEDGEPMDMDLDESMEGSEGREDDDDDEGSREDDDDDEGSREDDDDDEGSKGHQDDDDDGNDNNSDDGSALPVPSADDDASHRLLAPLVRHMLTQLDSTLTALHHARSACWAAKSDSSSAADSDSHATASTASRPAAKRPVGRPRRNPDAAAIAAAAAQSDTDCRPASSAATTDADKDPLSTPRRPGRPRKIHVPLPGESKHQMRIRIARQNHRPLPLTKADADAAFEAWLNRPPRSHASSPQSRKHQSAPLSCSYSRRKQLRLGLRDWSDVVAAAALAGFPEAVLARTAERCAALFNQGMLLRRLDQVSAEHGTGVDTLAFFPRRAASSPSPSPSPSPCASSPQLSLRQRRLASRTSSTSRSSATPASSLLHYCPVVSCARAAAGFSRLANLRRHLLLLHPGVCEVPSASTSLPHRPRYYGLVDGDEETVGGVHVDGFLKPIRSAQGWRGRGVALSRASKARGGGHEADGQDGDDETGDGY